VELNVEGSKQREYHILYQDVTNVIAFLIGHRPFKDALAYAPKRLYNAENHRVYNELYSGDWWWETQGKLPSGATVVPILIAVDKTQLTMHHGDKSAWPVYLTIGNLDQQVRRRQTSPANILVGFVPVVEEKDNDMKSKAYHKAMRTILKRKSCFSILTLYPIN